jgi:hypothetical protein
MCRRKLPTRQRSVSDVFQAEDVAARERVERAERRKGDDRKHGRRQPGASQQ